MKYLFSILMMVFSFSLLTAQTPFATVNSQKQDEVSGQQISLANPWFGANLSYNLNKDQPLDDNFLFNARVMYTPVTGEKFAVPIVATAGLDSDDIFNPNSGINVGIYPYYLVSSSAQLKVVAHGGIGYKVIGKGVEEGMEAPQQIRLVGGLEAAFFPKDGGLPTTLSVTPAYLYNTSTITNNAVVLEIDGIVPIANGLGLLVSGQLPFNKEIDGQFRFGVIVNGQL